MKRLFLLLVLALVAFLTLYHQRIFLWDPIATVTRDGVKQGGIRVMINYSNDILMDEKSTDRQRIYLVQNWNKVAQFSTGPLRCIQYLACMTDADRATADKLSPGPRDKRSAFAGASMTNKQIEFVDETGALVNVLLR